MDSGGWQNVILPSAYGAPGDVIQQGIQNKERQNEKLLSLFQQREALKAKQQGEYGVANLKNLNDNTDAQKLLLGDRYANDVTAEELKKTYNELIGQVSNLDPVTFDYLLHGKVDEFNNWHNQFKQDFDYSKQRVSDILSTNKNMNPDTAKQVAASELDSKYFKQDENGNWVRKSPEEIDMHKDPTAILTTDTMLGILAKDSGAGDVIKEEIQKEKLLPADFSKYSGNKGFINADAYDIAISPLKELTFKANGEPDLKMRTEDFHLGDGEYLKMLPKDTYDSYMKKPEFKSAVENMWAKIQKRFNEQGLQLDPQSRDMLKRDMLRDYIERNPNVDLSYVNKKVDKNIIPRPQVSIFNQPQNSPAAQWVNDMYSAAAAGDDRFVKNVASQLFSGIGKYKFQGDAYYLTEEQTGNGRPAIQINFEGNFKSKSGKEYKRGDYERIYLDDPNIKTKLAGLYQNFMGATQKVEDANFYKTQQPIMQQQPNKQAAPKTGTSQGYNVNGKPYTHDQLLKMGYSEDQLQQAIKLGTIKPQ